MSIQNISWVKLIYFFQLNNFTFKIRKWIMWNNVWMQARIHMINDDGSLPSHLRLFLQFQHDAISIFPADCVYREWFTINEQNWRILLGTSQAKISLFCIQFKLWAVRIRLQRKAISQLFTFTFPNVFEMLVSFAFVRIHLLHLDRFHSILYSIWR